jgi:hypothetical protein
VARCSAVHETLWKSLAILCACATSVHADARRARTALDKLDALYAPTGKLAGAPRVTAACADAAKLYEAQLAIPDATPPTGSVVDAETWGSADHVLGRTLHSLVDACKAPDHKLTILNKVQTADELVVTVDDRLRTLVDLGKPRTLPPSLAKFRATLAATKFPSKAFCSQIAALTKQVAGLTTPPATADAAKWQAALAAVKTDVDSLKCTKPAAPDEEIGGAFDDLRVKLAALVLLVPPG